MKILSIGFVVIINNSFKYIMKYILGYENKKICVVGAGRWGMNHVKTLNVLGSLGGVVEINKNRIDQIKYNFSNCSIYSNLDEAISAKF